MTRGVIFQRGHFLMLQRPHYNIPSNAVATGKYGVPIQVKRENVKIRCKSNVKTACFVEHKPNFAGKRRVFHGVIIAFLKSSQQRAFSTQNFMCASHCSHAPKQRFNLLC